VGEGSSELARADELMGVAMNLEGVCVGSALRVHRRLPTGSVKPYRSEVAC